MWKAETTAEKRVFAGSTSTTSARSKSLLFLLPCNHA
jgi:hypothetical protein